ncbi:hypothetical protein AB0O76_42965 [Streptomyces sp. NPDC086554]
MVRQFLSGGDLMHPQPFGEPADGLTSMTRAPVRRVRRARRIAHSSPV